MIIHVNGEPRELAPPVLLRDVLDLTEGTSAPRGMAVAVERRSDPEEPARHCRARGRGEGGDRHGRCKVVDLNPSIESSPINDVDRLIIAGKEFSSRLIMGTGGAPSLEVMEAALLASGTELTTVAMRRIDVGAPGSLLEILDRHQIAVLPQYRRLLHQRGRGADCPARPGGTGDQLDQAGGDRRRDHAASRSDRIA
jgi:hypothetical protein